MKSVQYTIRGVPSTLDGVVRDQARKYKKSMNAMLLEALKLGLGAGGEQTVYNDMDDLAGTWIEDPGFDAAIAPFETVDSELWK